ncbi:hypothetical protein EG329_006672 [Mollisiaceae sp. DMI_Dod_QoI]|nr:hypothetical protein EG329_006672 [Helotiales sp. DMI_Dod_QoI]
MGWRCCFDHLSEKEQEQELAGADSSQDDCSALVGRSAAASLNILIIRTLGANSKPPKTRSSIIVYKYLPNIALIGPARRTHQRSGTSVFHPAGMIVSSFNQAFTTSDPAIIRTRSNTSMQPLPLWASGLSGPMVLWSSLHGGRRCRQDPHGRIPQAATRTESGERNNPRVWFRKSILAGEIVNLWKRRQARGADAFVASESMLHRTTGPQPPGPEIRDVQLQTPGSRAQSLAVPDSLLFLSSLQSAGTQRLTSSSSSVLVGTSGCCWRAGFLCSHTSPLLPQCHYLICVTRGPGSSEAFLAHCNPSHGWHGCMDDMDPRLVGLESHNKGVRLDSTRLLASPRESTPPRWPTSVDAPRDHGTEHSSSPFRGSRVWNSRRASTQPVTKETAASRLLQCSSAPALQPMSHSSMMGADGGDANLESLDTCFPNMDAAMEDRVSDAGGPAVLSSPLLSTPGLAWPVLSCNGNFPRQPSPRVHLLLLLSCRGLHGHVELQP